MTKLTSKLYIGDSADESHADLDTEDIRSVLNVAQDLQPTRGWRSGVEYMQVGLIDGPGNPPSAYCAAVLALGTLLRHGRTLVVCHTGSRSLAVAVMYLATTVKRSWGEWINLLRERVDADLPVVHQEHAVAMEKINWRLLADLLEE